MQTADGQRRATQHRFQKGKKVPAYSGTIYQWWSHDHPLHIGCHCNLAQAFLALPLRLPIRVAVSRRIVRTKGSAVGGLAIDLDRADVDESFYTTLCGN